MNVDIPYFEYPIRGASTKRQVIYENLKAFQTQQQFQVIEELFQQKLFPTEARKKLLKELRSELDTRIAESKSNHEHPQIDSPNPVMRKEREFRRDDKIHVGLLTSLAVLFWLFARPFVWTYKLFHWFVLAVAKEAGTKIVQIVGGAIAFLVIAYLVHLFS